MSESSPLNSLLRCAAERPFWTAMAGGLLQFLSFSPVGLAPLAWVSIVPWVLLIAVPEFVGKKPLRSIWLAGLLYWAAEVYYISIPHPALWGAWIMLFCYLSVYPLLFVWVGRKLRWGQKVPLWLSAALTFTGLEWIRAHMITGFGFSMLANSQYQNPLILQICDLAGAYGLSFLMVTFAAGVTMLLLGQRLSGVITSIVAFTVVLGYGTWRQNQIDSLPERAIDVLVLQGNIDTRFPATEQELFDYQKQLFEDYLNLHRTWLANRDDDQPMPDVIIWPEGKYPIADELSGDADRGEFLAYHELLRQSLPLGQFELPEMIVGNLTRDSGKGHVFNSALLLGGQGQVFKRYYKRHLVVFGEFVPFAEWLPILKRMTPIGSGFQAGDYPVGFRVAAGMEDEFIASPSICFESAVCHVIRESVQHLRSIGEDPDVLINVTDDGWFYGQAVLDHHLACNVIRAVENRRPMIVAANTGLSAFIGASGEIFRQGPRRKSEVMEETFTLKKVQTLFGLVGDWPAMVCTIILVIAIVIPAKKDKLQPPVQTELPV